LDKDFRVENPVTRARGYAELIKHAMPGLDVALAEIEALKTQVRAIEIMAATANAGAMNASAPFAAPGPTGPTGYGVGGGVAGGYVGGGGVTGGPQSGIFGQGATLGSGDMPRGGILIDRPLVLREEEERKRKGDGS
jgi:hypothetical protein